MKANTAVRCPNCQCEIDGQAKFCIYCGTRQPNRSGEPLHAAPPQPSWIERRAARKPILLELFAFILFGALVCAILWHMYGDLGLRPHGAPVSPARSTGNVPPVPVPVKQVPATPPAAEKPISKAPSPAVAPENVTLRMPNGVFKRTAPGTLQSSDGHATVRVWETAGNKPPSPPSNSITYHARGAHWSVVSGYDGDKVFYQKTLIAKDHASTFLMEYPKSEKAKYQSANNMLAHSFRRTR